MTILLVLALLFPSPESGQQQWYQIVEIKGTGTKQTDVFETKGTKWRVRWEAKPDDRLTIYVYDRNGELISAISSKNARDESYVHKPGKYYLAIAATEAYTIIVEDWR